MGGGKRVFKPDFFRLVGELRFELPAIVSIGKVVLPRFAFRTMQDRLNLGIDWWFAGDGVLAGSEGNKAFGDDADFPFGDSLRELVAILG